MEDAVAFLNDLKTKLEGAEASKVIATGCSYPGHIATLLRQNRSDVFQGAVAQSCAFEGFVTEDDRTFQYDQNIWINNVYQQKSYEAWQKVAKAYQALQDAIKIGDFEKLQSDFSLCDTPTEETVSTVFIFPAQVHLAASLYNFNNSLLPFPDPLNTMVDVAMSEDDPMQLLNKTIWTLVGPLGVECMNASDPQGSVYGGISGLSAGSFTYLTCKCEPYFDKSTAETNSAKVPLCSVPVVAITSTRPCFASTTIRRTG